LLSTPAVVEQLAARVETSPPPKPEELRNSGAEAILVLLASMRRNNPELGGASTLSSLSLERIDYALALHRMTGLPIVVSGGSVRGDTRPLAELGAEWLQDRAGVTPLAVENVSHDTWENAQRSAQTLRRLGIDRVLLVTHAFHMPRAMLSASAAGIDAVATPFGFEHDPSPTAPPTAPLDWLPHPGRLGLSYLMLHELAGLYWYRQHRQ
jgi:uncharacterized SAM-binding protein YcdF (DUF218 family)